MSYSTDDLPGDEVYLGIEYQDDSQREVESHHSGVQLIYWILRDQAQALLIINRNILK